MVFGYLAVAKDVPLTLRKLLISKAIPESWKIALLQRVANRDFWYVLSFTIFLIVLYFLLLWRTTGNEVEDEDSGSKALSGELGSKKKQDHSKARRDRAVAVLKRYRLIRIIRSFGLVIIREKLLDLMKVGLYGTFRRQENWSPEPNRFCFIDRVTFIDGTGSEYQYSRNFRDIIVRTHPFDLAHYERHLLRPPAISDIKLLLVASNFFLFWFLGYLFCFPFTRLFKR